jgi:3-hydroxyacyl-[acyl-carrier-protein] dehydratase
MILKDTFYQLTRISENENQLIATIVLNEKSPIFEGHFPGNPVTPGVAQLEIVKEILSTHYNRQIQLKSISNCKYLAILNPLQNPEVTITFSITEMDGDIKTNVIFAADETIFTKISGIYY